MPKRTSKKISVVLGLSDAGFYTCLYATIGTLFKERLEIGFAGIIMQRHFAYCLSILLDNDPSLLL